MVQENGITYAEIGDIGHPDSKRAVSPTGYDTGKRFFCVQCERYILRGEADIINADSQIVECLCANCRDKDPLVSILQRMEREKFEDEL